MNKNIILIGKKSFLGHYIKNNLRKKIGILHLNLREFKKLNDKKIEKYDYICNCSISKKYQNHKYKLENDVDFEIINKIKNLRIKYIFLSSRKVYATKKNLSEINKLKPLNNYAKNKVITENKIRSLLRGRSLILRISNIIGKPIKNPKKITKNFMDNYIEFKNKNKIIKYKDYYKDFLSIDQFTEIFFNIIKNNLVGIYNVSLGEKVYISELLNWLDQHNSKIFKPINHFNNDDSFYLNNKKLLKKINIKIKKSDLKKFCLNFN
jgi:nucleoside-diphosphate-sugar epimerase